MKVTQLKINGLRNLSNIHIHPCPSFNLFCGVNGSGKTSLLESLYLLGFGRSFRAPTLSTLIHHDSNTLVTFTEVVDKQANIHFVGFEKNREGRLKLKIDGQTARGIPEVAEFFPIQILCADSFDILTAGPQVRRQFLDWGVFHVEPLFFEAWLKYTRALRQRNSLLKARSLCVSQLQAWDKELIHWGALLTVYRKAYMDRFIVKFTALLKTLLTLDSLSIEFYPGWVGESLQDAFEASGVIDRKLGYTRVGPQRADIVFKIQDALAGQILSRGQQKLFVCALILAQGQLIWETAGKSCMYLLDDLAAELDLEARRRVIEQMADTNAQVFITGIEKNFLKESIQGFEHKLFHVKQGQVELESLD